MHEIDFLPFDELDFLNAFKNDNLSIFKSYFDDNEFLDYLLLTDSNQLVFAIIRFSNSCFCESFYSEDNRFTFNHFHNPNLDKFPTHNLNLLFSDLDHLIEEKENIIHKKHFVKKKTDIENKSLSPFILKKKDLHTDTQFIMKIIADIVGFDCWIAKNDKSRVSHGNELGLSTIKHFPNFNVDKSVLNTFKLIDCIWFENERPISCFEVETSTSIYSALLRFADLDISLPFYNISYYIIIPKKRLNKALKELSRPSIQSLSITQKTNVLFIEDLEVLFQKINGLHGFISSNILNKISYNVNELDFIKTSTEYLEV